MTNKEKLQALAELRDPSLRLNKFITDRAVAEAIVKLDIVKGEKGDSGDDGYTPKKGSDYFTNQEVDAIINYIRSLIKDGEPGDKGDKGNVGDTPRRGIDYWTKEDRAKIEQDIKKMMPKMPVHEPIKHHEIVKKVVDDAMKGVATDESVVKTILANPTLRMLLHGGGTGGTTLTIHSETPVGLINGVNVTYAVSFTIATILSFAINGQFLHPSEYSAAGTTITFNTALPASLSGTSFTIVYS